MDTNTNPTKITGSDKFLPCLQELLDGYCLEDPPTEKKLPVEADVPELLFDMGLRPKQDDTGTSSGGPQPHCILLPALSGGVHLQGHQE